ASTTTTAGLVAAAWSFFSPVTRMVSVCWPGLKSCSVTIGVRASCGRAKRSTRLAGPPSTLTSAIPASVLRSPIHVTHLPLNVNCTVAFVTVDRTAVPPLHPNLESAGIQSPGLKVTRTSDSSNRPGVAAGVGVGVGVGVDVVVGVGVGVWVAAGAMPLGLPPSPPPPPQETSVPASRRTQTHRMQRFMPPSPSVLADSEGEGGMKRCMPPSPSVLADSGAWRTRVRHAAQLYG